MRFRLLNPLNLKDLFLQGFRPPYGSRDVCPWISPVKMTLLCIKYRYMFNITNARRLKYQKNLLCIVVMHIILYSCVLFFLLYAFELHSICTFYLLLLSIYTVD